MFTHGCADIDIVSLIWVQKGKHAEHSCSPDRMDVILSHLAVLLELAAFMSMPDFIVQPAA